MLVNIFPAQTLPNGRRIFMRIEENRKIPTYPGNAQNIGAPKTNTGQHGSLSMEGENSATVVPQPFLSDFIQKMFLKNISIFHGEKPPSGLTFQVIYIYILFCNTKINLVKKIFICAEAVYCRRWKELFLSEFRIRKKTPGLASLLHMASGAYLRRWPRRRMQSLSRRRPMKSQSHSLPRRCFRTAVYRKFLSHLNRIEKFPRQKLELYRAIRVRFF